MGRPLLLDAWERPATTVVTCVCCAVWWYLHSRGLGYDDVGVSYRKAVRERQLWRCVTASFSHVSFLHLLFNMSSLWSLGVVEQMGSRGAGWGTVWYLRYTLVMLVGSMALVLATTHVLVRYAKVERYERVTSVGYSCVVFGWMTYVSVKGTPSGAVSLFGFARAPVNLAPFGSLLFTSLVVPQASFIGHLAGIATGYLVAWDAFAWLDTTSTTALLLCVVAAAAGTRGGGAAAEANAASLVPEPPPPASFFSFFRKATPGDFAGAGRRLGGEPAPSRLLGSAESNA